MPFVSSRTCVHSVSQPRSSQRVAASQKAAGSELYLSPEQEAEIRTLRKQEVDARKEVRELQKDLKRDKDKLAGNAMLANIFIMPLLVILLGIGLFVKRRGATRAR
jgi:ABC-type uncharacterized transport system involved in gliding motility auxiliary subunit